jgi:hypothetical protein
MVEKVQIRVWLLRVGKVLSDVSGSSPNDQISVLLDCSQVFTFCNNLGVGRKGTDYRPTTDGLKRKQTIAVYVGRAHLDGNKHRNSD